MSAPRFLLGAVFAAGLGLSAGSAQAAGICKADHLSCGTTMPVGGYCECTSKGSTEGGTVEARPVSRGAKVNSTAGGCGANPNAPGCKH